MFLFLNSFGGFLKDPAERICKNCVAVVGTARRCVFAISMWRSGIQPFHKSLPKWKRATQKIKINQKIHRRLEQLLDTANLHPLHNSSSNKPSEHCRTSFWCHLNSENGLQHVVYHRLIECCKRKFMYYSRFEEVEYKAESDAGVFWSIPDVVGDSGTLVRYM